MVSAPSTPFAKPMSREIMGHKKKVHSVAASSVGRKLASGSVDQSARVFDVEHGVQAGKEIELKGHSDSVDQVSWDPTAVDRLATISADKSLRLWDIRAGSRCVANVAMSGENINVNWHPDGTCLAVGNRDDVVSFVDARTHKVTRTEKYPYEVNEIAWDASGDVFYLTTGLGTVEACRWRCPSSPTCTPYARTPPDSTAWHSTRRDRAWRSAPPTPSSACGTSTSWPACAPSRG